MATHFHPPVPYAVRNGDATIVTVDVIVGNGHSGSISAAVSPPGTIIADQKPFRIMDRPVGTNDDLAANNSSLFVSVAADRYQNMDRPIVVTYVLEGGISPQSWVDEYDENSSNITRVFQFEA